MSSGGCLGVRELTRLHERERRPLRERAEKYLLHMVFLMVGGTWIEHVTSSVFKELEPCGDSGLPREIAVHIVHSMRTLFGPVAARLLHGCTP